MDEKRVPASGRAEPLGRASRRLRWEFRLLAAFCGSSLGLAVVQLLAGDLTLAAAVPAFVVGTSVGAILSRAYRFQRQPGTQVVVGRIDQLGAALLIASAAFTLVRLQVLPVDIDALWPHSRMVLSAGIALGRLGLSIVGVWSAPGAAD